MEPFLRHLKCVISLTLFYRFPVQFDDKIAAHRGDVQWKMALTLHLGLLLGYDVHGRLTIECRSGCGENLRTT